ncbi:MAG: hypothetical protein IPQ07_30245 [Myxococcales bacterium]|nr:hypothetical protein [Myxococcales bacterium]
MKAAALLLLALVACQRGETDTGAPTQSVLAAAPGSDYALDIGTLCNAVVGSGADKIDEDARALTIANYLGANLKTAESRKFLVQIQPLVGEAKATALDSEAKRVGLTGCALAAEWRTPPAPKP